MVLEGGFFFPLSRNLVVGMSFCSLSAAFLGWASKHGAGSTFGCCLLLLSMLSCSKNKSSIRNARRAAGVAQLQAIIKRSVKIKMQFHASKEEAEIHHARSSSS